MSIQINNKLSGNWMIGFLSLLAVAGLAGCTTAGSTVDTAAEETISYIEAKKNYAKAIATAISNSNPQYRIVAITGPQYAPGTVLDPANPVDLLTRKCLLTDDILATENWADFPTLSRSTSFKADLSVTDLVQRYVSEIANLGLNIDKTKSMNFSMTELSQQLAPRDEFLEALAQEECYDAIFGRDVIVVRGVVLGKESLKTASQLGSGLKIDALGDSAFNVIYGNEKNYVLENKAPEPKFHIITAIPAEAETPRGMALPGDMESRLQTPSDAQIDALYR